MKDNNEVIKSLNDYVFNNGPLRGNNSTKVSPEKFKNKRAGLSVAWIFQNSETEIPAILKDIASFDARLFALDNFEIILCGPGGDKLIKLIENNKFSNEIRILNYERSNSELSEFIGIKKNFVILNSRFSKLAILHSRIRIDQYFIDYYLKNFDFYLSTPRVMIVNNGNKLPYLDLIFLKNYNLVENNNKFLWGVESDWLLRILKFFYKTYIDGGCLVFNFDKVGALFISEYHKWGYAEDVNLSWRADLMSFQLTRSDVIVYSDSNKINFYLNPCCKFNFFVFGYRIFVFLKFILPFKFNSGKSRNKQ